MKILFIGYLHGFGGAEKQIILLANEMINRNHDVNFISLYKNNECYGMDERIKRKFIEDKGFSIFKILSRYIELRNEIKKIKPDLIINFWFQSAYLTSFMNKNYTGKIIYCERGDPNDKEYRGLLGLVRKIAFSRINGFVFQTTGARNYFNKKIIDRSIIIPNSVSIKNTDIIKFEYRKNKIVCVGRLHEQKNIQLLINAFYDIKDKYKNYTLHIYGDGELKSELEILIKNLGLNKKVFLEGAKKNIYDYIKDARLFVLSSNYEGMPNALLEAMLLGIPCITTNWSPGGAYDILSDKENGLIVQKNNKEELSKAISYMLDNDDFSKKCSKQTVKDKDKYSLVKTYDKWEKYFKEMLK